MEQPNLIDLPEIVTIQAANNHLKRSDTRPHTLRFTIDQGPKFVGKRISISLGTKDISLAERISATSIESLKKAGFVLSDIRFFGKPEEDFDNLALHDNIKAIIFDLRGEDDEMADTLQDAVDNSK